MMSERDVRRMAGIAWRTIERSSHVARRERGAHRPLAAPRRASRRGTPAWSRRSIAEKRPLRRILCSRDRW